MRKSTFFITKTKAQISFAVTAKLISAFVFATWIVQFLYFLNPTSNHLLYLYSSVCVGPVPKLHCWFSHDVTHFIMICSTLMILRHVETLNNFIPELCS